MTKKALFCCIIIFILGSFSQISLAQENEHAPQLVNPENKTQATTSETRSLASNDENTDFSQEMQNNVEQKVDVEEVNRIIEAERLTWFKPKQLSTWFERVSRKTDRSYLKKYFEALGYTPPKNTFAMIAPIRIRKNKLELAYYSYGNSAFAFSMTPTGEEVYWPASTVKLTAAVLALLKVSEYGLSSQATVHFEDFEGQYDGTIEQLCREAIIPSDNTAYNRLMEIAGFDEINDVFLPKVLHLPKMILQRRYVRRTKDDDLRTSPVITFEEQGKRGSIPARVSSGKMRPQCPRESNCTTLVELAEVMLRVVMHARLPKDYRIPLKDADIEMLQEALREAPSCIGDGVAETLGSNAILYNKGGKVVGDDRLEVGVVSTFDGKQKFLLALSMPYYEGVEKETNQLAKQLILAMQALDLN